LQNALAEKGAWWVAMCYVGLVAKSQLKVRLRCKACHAEERAAFRSTHSATPLSPRNSAKKTTVKKSYQETPFKKWFLIDFRKLFRIRIGCVEKCVKYEKISSTNALRIEKLMLL